MRGIRLFLFSLIACVVLCALHVNGFVDVPSLSVDPIAPTSGGRLYINSSNQLTCINSDSSTCLTSGGAVSTANLISPESRILQGGTQASAQGKQVTVASGATQTLVNFTGQGYLTDFWFATSLTSGQSYTAMIVVIVDGTTIFNGPAQLFFGANYFTDSVSAVYANDFLQFAGAGGKMTIPIPFSTSLRINYTNDLGTSMQLWWTIGYQTGVANNWGRYSHLNTAWGGQYASAVGVKSDTSIPLTQDQIGMLLNATSLTPGKLLGLYITWDSYGSASNQTFLEGPIVISIDGSQAYKTSGSEDYFGMPGYFAAVSPGFGTRLQTLTLKQSSPPLYAGVRFHVQEPMLFQSALNITAQAGLSSTGNTFSGTVHIAYMIWYYTS